MTFKNIDPFTVDANDIQSTYLINTVRKYRNFFLQLPFVNDDSVDEKTFTQLDKNKLADEINQGGCDYYQTKYPVTNMNFVNNMYVDLNTYRRNVTVKSVTYSLVAVINKQNDLIYVEKVPHPVDELALEISNDGYMFSDIISKKLISKKMIDYITAHGFTTRFLVDIDAKVALTDMGDSMYSPTDVNYVRHPDTIRGVELDDGIKII